MDFRDYLHVLQERWRIVVACLLLAVGAAAAVTLAAQPMYEAKAQLFVSASSPDSTSVAGLNQGGQFAQQRVKSYTDVVNSRMVTDDVVRTLGLSQTPQQLSGQIEASAPVDTVLIAVAVRDPSAASAQAIANAVAERFTTVAAELETPTRGTVSPVKVTVVRQAELPVAPVSPRIRLNLLLGLVAGLVIGICTAVLREVLDTSLGSVEDVQEALDLPTLGVIAYDGASDVKPLIVHVSPHSGRAEAFRQLRTNLQFLDVDRPPRSILLTSSLPGEGKSTTACNLAITLTQAGLRVALVEGDLRRPRLAQYLGLEGAVGLTDVLAGRAPLEDVLQPWGDGGLLVLPSGPTPPNPSELLGSQQMRSLLRLLEAQVDLVLVDSPPLLPVTDAAVLSSLVSGVVVVVRAGSTRREAAGRAVGILQAVDAHVYGAILNMAPQRTRGGYGYGYGYGYGSAVSGDAATLLQTTPSRAAGRGADAVAEDVVTDGERPRSPDLPAQAQALPVGSRQ